MQKKTTFTIGLVLAACSMLSSLVFLAGCNVSNGDEVVRNVDTDYSGFYTNPNGNVVGTVSGASISSLDLIQTGDRLQAVDNNGQIFRGSISRSNEGSATFSMEGTTTSGIKGIIAGSLTGSGTSGTMRGNYVEDNLFSTVFGTASIPGANTNSTGNATTTLTISPSGNITLASGGTRTFTASGGSGTYSWVVSNSTVGRVNPTTGATTTYTALTAGTQTVTVSNNGATASTTITQQ